MKLRVGVKQIARIYVEKISTLHARGPGKELQNFLDNLFIFFDFHLKIEKELEIIKHRSRALNIFETQTCYGK